MLGILLALNAERAKQLLSGLRPAWIGILWAAALTGIAIVPGDLTHVVGLVNAPVLLMNGLAAALIIALSIVDGRAARILMSPVARYLGRISYSLYLLHLVVIVAVIHAVGGAWPLPLAILAAIPLAIIGADISQRFIEAPSQRLGKAVAARIGSRRGVAMQGEAPEPAF
jgi:peptidoglycan/LPS O-acetylase OafA/YrhL